MSMSTSMSTSPQPATAPGGLAVIGQIAPTVTAMRAAADVIEGAGIAGLSVTCDDEQISIQVGEHLGDAATRAGLVQALAATFGAMAVRADSPAGTRSWVRAEASISGLRVHVFTSVAIQHADGLPLACDAGGNIAQATSNPQQRLPTGWRWLTTLDPVPPADAPPANTEVA